MDPAAEMELQAAAEAMSNGRRAGLEGQFRIEPKGQPLPGELDNSCFSLGTAISFCLVKPTVTIPLVGPQTDAQGVVQFELKTQNEQTVPFGGLWTHGQRKSSQRRPEAARAMCPCPQNWKRD
jgi:hypothetical protein